MNQRGADDTDRDFLYPDEGDVKHRAGIGDGGKTNQACGITGQHKGIGAGRAFKQG